MGASVVGVSLALCSTAFACTVFRGKFTVTGSGSNPGKVISVGNNAGMQYCPGFPTGTASVPRSGATVTVTVNKAKNPSCPLSRLPANTYDVNFLNGPAHSKSPDRDWQLDCMSGLVGPVKIGQLKVDQYGAGGPKTLALPAALMANGANDESAVCISDANGSFGNQVPVTVL